MMPTYRQANRKMFWRIIGRLLVANPGRLFVILLALGSGAAITAALLNLQIDAKRRLTTEFRSFGANVIITPQEASVPSSTAKTLPESVYQTVPNIPINQGGKSAFLYVMAQVTSYGSEKVIPAIVVGAREEGNTFARIPLFTEVSAGGPSRTESNCFVGMKVAAQLRVHADDRIFLKNEDREDTCHIAAVQTTGGEEDNQVYVGGLEAAQHLAALPGRISLMQVNFPGTPAEVDRFIATLQQKLPDTDVHGIRQFTEGEAKIYNRISGLLTATVLIILVLTFFCVMAAMTNVAMERRNDVGLMKALGGSVRRIVRLFFAEAALLGLTGGLIGSTVGILLSIWLGKAVFGLAARPRLIVYPIAIMLTLLVSLASALPLRRLASIRPASVFRGEA
jgi:putative ABC transport system permease protein